MRRNKYSVRTCLNYGASHTCVAIAILVAYCCAAPQAVRAGTGSIFSPSGLPQSSNQSYTVPAPGVEGTTVTFPTPPLPLGGSLQSFSGSPLPAPGAAATPGGGTNGIQTTPRGGAGSSVGTAGGGTANPGGATVETGKVEDFFQCGSGYEAAPAKKSGGGAAAAAQAVTTPVGAAGKLLWHTLYRVGDNLGVPMFIGKDNDLDPSLRNVRLTPQVVPPSNRTAPAPNTRGGRPPSLSPNTGGGAPSLRKIPENELEGTEVSPPNDEPKPTSN